MTTVTRFAPSPTGYMHVGNLRTALMNYLIARKTGGTFILRLDDTDPERSRQTYIDGLKQDLEWLGIEWDREERQSLRLDRYRDVAGELKAAGRIYECFESPTELELKRKKQLNMGKPPVYDRASLHLSEAGKDAMRAEGRTGYWRFKLDPERIGWKDGILGDLSIDAAAVSDPVLIKASGQVLYTFASPVDDSDMGITHVVRGGDHVTNTATQIQIIKAIGGKVPAFAHHSLLTGPHGEELSKRLGALSIRDLRTEGIAPEALLSMLARLGSSQPIDLRMSIDELADGFDLSHFGSAPTKFDPADLIPLTRTRNRHLPFPEVADRIAALGIPAKQAEQFWAVASRNIDTLDDLAGWADLCLNGADPMIAEEDASFIFEAMTMLPDAPYTESTWQDWTSAVKAATGRKGKNLFMPLRKAVTGMDHGPEMGALMPLLHKVRARA